MTKLELEDIKARLAALEGPKPEQKISQTAPINYLDLMLTREVPEWQRDMAKAVPDDLVRAIVADNRPSTVAAPTQEAKPRGTGWVDPTPLRPVPGTDLIDAIVQKFEPMPPKAG